MMARQTTLDTTGYAPTGTSLSPSQLPCRRNEQQQLLMELELDDTLVIQDKPSFLPSQHQTESWPTRRIRPSSARPALRNDGASPPHQLGEPNGWLDDTTKSSTFGTGVRAGAPSGKPPRARPQSAKPPSQYTMHHDSLPVRARKSATFLSGPHRLKQQVWQNRQEQESEELGYQKAKVKAKAAPHSTNGASSINKPSSATLVVQAVRQNIVLRDQLMSDLELELSHNASVPFRKLRLAQLSKEMLKKINKLRMLTLVVIEMVLYFQELLIDTPYEVQLEHKRIERELLKYLFKIASSDMDFLAYFLALSMSPDSLLMDSRLIRNPVLEGVTLDCSELLLCACSTHCSSVYELLRNKQQSFAIDMKNKIPLWQLLPSDRVLKVLLALVRLEMEHNVKRTAPSHLLPERISHEPLRLNSKQHQSLPQKPSPALSLQTRHQNKMIACGLDSSSFDVKQVSSSHDQSASPKSRSMKAVVEQDSDALGIDEDLNSHDAFPQDTIDRNGSTSPLTHSPPRSLRRNIPDKRQDDVQIHNLDKLQHPEAKVLNKVYTLCDDVHMAAFEILCQLDRIDVTTSPPVSPFRSPSVAVVKPDVVASRGSAAPQKISANTNSAEPTPNTQFLQSELKLLRRIFRQWRDNTHQKQAASNGIRRFVVNRYRGRFKKKSAMRVLKRSLLTYALRRRRLVVLELESKFFGRWLQYWEEIKCVSEFKRQRRRERQGLAPDDPRDTNVHNGREDARVLTPIPESTRTSHDIGQDTRQPRSPSRESGREQDRNRDKQALAVTKIQSHFRGYKCRRHTNQSKSKANSKPNQPYRIASGMMTMQQIQAAVVIQAHWRGYFTRMAYRERKLEKEFRKRMTAATCLQSRFRGYLDRNKFHHVKREKQQAQAQSTAGTKIQAQWRGRRCRSQYAKEKAKHQAELQARQYFAATQLQSNWRRHLTRQQLKHQQQLHKQQQQQSLECMHHACATRIQSLWRGHFARKTCQQRRNQLETLQHTKATQIETRWRCHQAKKELQQKKAEQRQIRLNDGATKIQSHWRGTCARKEVQQKKIKEYEALQNACTTKIQSQWRGTCARRELQQKKAERESLRNAKAIQIETRWRCHRAQKELQQMKAEHDTQLNDCSTKIQSQWRGACARKEYQRQKDEKNRRRYETVQRSVLLRLAMTWSQQQIELVVKALAIQLAAASRLKRFFRRRVLSSVFRRCKPTQKAVFYVLFRHATCWVRKTHCRTVVQCDHALTATVLNLLFPTAASTTKDQQESVLSTVIDDLTDSLDGSKELVLVGVSDLPSLQSFLRRMEIVRLKEKHDRSLFEIVELLDLEELEAFARNGGDLHARDHQTKRNALHHLSCIPSERESVTSRLAALRFLVESAQLDVNAADYQGDTPLLLFVANGHFEMVRWLVASNIKVPLTHVNHSHRNALHVACEQDHVEIASYLQDVSDSLGQPMLLHHADSRGDFPLHLLASKGLIECARSLLVHWSHHKEDIAELLGAGDGTGKSALQVAILYNQIDFAVFLVEQTAEFFPKCLALVLNEVPCDPFRRLPLLLAVQCTSNSCHSTIHLLQVLILYGADVNGVDCRGDSALHMAALVGGPNATQLMRFLVESGVDSAMLNDDFERAGDVAMRTSHLECLPWLLPPEDDSARWHPTTSGRSSSSDPIGRMLMELETTRSQYWREMELNDQLQLVEEDGKFSSEEEDEEEADAD